MGRRSRGLCAGWLLKLIEEDFRSSKNSKLALANRAIARFEKISNMPELLVMVRMHRWTYEELKRLAAIVAAGGTPLRAAAALNRGI